MFDINTTTAEVVNIAATQGSVRRGAYDEIIDVPSAISDLVQAVRRSAGWTIGFEPSRRRGGYDARNIDVYGYDVPRNLAVVQLRRSFKRKEGYYTETSKVYALIGLSDGQLFSHVLHNSPRRLPDLRTRTPESVVRWAEKMIFGLKSEEDVASIKRQGDIALVPVKKLPADAEKVDDSVTFRGSHLLVGQIYKAGDTYYCVGGRDTRLLHTKREHGAVFTRKGELFRVVVGRRGDEPWWIDATLGD